MKRNHKTEEQKRLRKLWMDYINLQDARRKSGEWIDVEPYQKGWIRYFVLRDDAKNRRDAREMQQVLDMINTTIFCNKENFLRRNWKTSKWEPIPHHPKYLTEEQFEKLNEKHQSFFSRREWIDRVHRPFSGRDQNVVRIGYIFKYDLYLILHKEPYIVTQQWIPNQEIESLYGELHHKINSQGLWNKIGKAMAWRGDHRDYDGQEKTKYKNFDGLEYDSSDVDET